MSPLLLTQTSCTARFTDTFLQCSSTHRRQCRCTLSMPVNCARCPSPMEIAPDGLALFATTSVSLWPIASPKLRRHLRNPAMVAASTSAAARISETKFSNGEADICGRDPAIWDKTDFKADAESSAGSRD